MLNLANDEKSKKNIIQLFFFEANVLTFLKHSGFFPVFLIYTVGQTTMMS